ncbi:hypothetical protein J6U76_08255 [bacterium]|nr:hypothetical protein [bacterium]
MKYIKLFMLLSAITLTSFKSEGLNISASVWLVSENIVSNDALRLKLQDIEVLAKRHKRAEAIRMIKELRKNNNLSTVVLKDKELLPLVLDGMELYYWVCDNSDNKTIPQKVNSLLSKHKEKAEGRGLTSYKQIYQILRRYYSHLGDTSKAIDIQKQVILYDPKDYIAVTQLIDYAKKDPETCGELDDFIKEYVGAGGTLYEELKLAAIITSKDEITKKMARACEWLEKNADASEKIIARSLPIISMLADSKHPQTLVDYYHALTNLALRQSSNEERLTVFSMAINERQKLITAAPEILPPKTP